MKKLIFDPAPTTRSDVIDALKAFYIAYSCEALQVYVTDTFVKNASEYAKEEIGGFEQKLPEGAPKQWFGCLVHWHAPQFALSD